MRTMKLITLAIFTFSLIFIAVGIGVFFMPLSYITINNVRQAATPENTHTFRIIFLSVFGGIGLVALVVGIVMAVKVKRYNSAFAKSN